MPRIPPVFLIAIALFGVGGLVVLGAVVYFVGSAWFGLPVGAQGPDQPIAFPHTVHAGTLEDGGLALDCTFCHRNVAKGAAATIPSVQQCMFCHSQVTGTTAAAIAEIGKFRGLATDGEGNLLKDDDGNFVPLESPMDPLVAINWARVNRLPDHVQFVHDVHIRFLMANPDQIVNATNLTVSSEGAVDAAQTCSTCHGAVATMTKVKQVRALKMGDCVDCHREYNAPTDCAICHY